MSRSAREEALDTVRGAPVDEDRWVQVLRAPVEPSDAQLVRRIRDGDRWAEKALYRRHASLVLGTAVRLLRDRTEAEDVAQETFLLAFESIGQLRDAEAVRAWLLRIVVSRVHRRFRRRRLLRLLGFVDAYDEGLAQAAGPETTPEQRAALARIDRVLDGLPAPVRIAWTLRFVLGASLEEVAAACDCSLATVKRRIAAAQRRLQAEAGVEVLDG
ncbi:MAG: RNA polymerase sigma factor [Myxococcales bacterium]|nr:RNA polymerase sigma factor [Myxococcales bacterium]